MFYMQYCLICFLSVFFISNVVNDINLGQTCWIYLIKIFLLLLVFKGRGPGIAPHRKCWENLTFYAAFTFENH